MEALTWLCTNHRCHALGATTVRALGGVAERVRRTGLRRLHHDQWVRYRMSLDKLPPCSESVAVQPVDAEFMARLRQHPERDEPQLRTAVRFWQGGFARGYAWMEGGEPLCIQWLITDLDEVGRQRLGSWAGMYPPQPRGVAFEEGIYTFRRGLRRRGGAATSFALAVRHQARAQGVTEVCTHIHVDNIAAHRWAGRVGLHAYGMIRRYALDLPGFRQRYLYLHTLEPVPLSVQPTR